MYLLIPFESTLGRTLWKLDIGVRHEMVTLIEDQIFQIQEPSRL